MILEQLYNEWKSLQPIDPIYRQRLDSKFMLDFNYNSNHLEGNTLTYGQTKLLFWFGKVEGIAPLRDYEEMKAHNVGLELIKQEASDADRPLTEEFVRSLNKTILVEDFQTHNDFGSYTVHVGVYKTRLNSVITQTGKVFKYASPDETPALMGDLVRWVNEQLDGGELSAVELAALVHFRYIRIHPFEDGNGRIARLLMNYLLLRKGYPMIIVESANKKEYLDMLELCDVAVGDNPYDGANATVEQIQSFVAYIEKLVVKALELNIKGAKGEDIEEEGDFAKEIALKKQDVTAKQRKEEEFANVLAQNKQNIVDRLIPIFISKINTIFAPAIREAESTFTVRYQRRQDNDNFEIIGFADDMDMDIVRPIIKVDKDTYCVAIDIIIEASIIFGRSFEIHWVIDLDRNDYEILAPPINPHHRGEVICQYQYTNLPSEKDWKNLVDITKKIISRYINDTD